MTDTPVLTDEQIKSIADNVAHAGELGIGVVSVATAGRLIAALRASRERADDAEQNRNVEHAALVGARARAERAEQEAARLAGMRGALLSALSLANQPTATLEDMRRLLRTALAAAQPASKEREG